MPTLQHPTPRSHADAGAEERTGWTPSPPPEPVRILKRPGSGVKVPGAPVKEPKATPKPASSKSKSSSPARAKPSPTSKPASGKDASKAKPSATAKDSKPTTTNETKETKTHDPKPTAPKLNLAAKEFKPLNKAAAEFSPVFQPPRPSLPIKITSPEAPTVKLGSMDAQPVNISDSDVKPAHTTSKPDEPALPPAEANDAPKAPSAKCESVEVGRTSSPEASAGARARMSVEADRASPAESSVGESSERSSSTSPSSLQSESPASVSGSGWPFDRPSHETPESDTPLPGWSGWPTETAPNVADNADNAGWSDWPTETAPNDTDNADNAGWSGWPSERPPSRASTSGGFTAVTRGTKRRALPSQESAFQNRFAALYAAEAAERAKNAEDWSGATPEEPASRAESEAPETIMCVSTFGFLPSQDDVEAEEPENHWRGGKGGQEKDDQEAKARNEDEDEEQEDWTFDAADSVSAESHSGWTPPATRVPLPDVRSRRRSTSNSNSNDWYAQPPPGSNYKGRHYDPDFHPDKHKTPRSLSSTSGASKRRKRKDNQALWTLSADTLATRAASSARTAARPTASRAPPLAGPGGDQTITPRQASKLLDDVMRWILTSLMADRAEADVAAHSDSDTEFPYGPARSHPPETDTRERHNDSYLWRALWRDLGGVRVEDEQYLKKGGGEQLFMLLARESRLYRDECKYLKQLIEGKRGGRGGGAKMSVPELDDLKKFTEGRREGYIKGYDDGMACGYDRGYDRGVIEGGEEAEKQARRRERAAKAKARAEREPEPEASRDSYAGAAAPKQSRPSSAKRYPQALNDAEEEDKDAKLARLQTELTEARRIIGVRDKSIEVLLGKSYERGSEIMRLKEMLKLEKYSASVASDADSEMDFHPDDDDGVEVEVEVEDETAETGATTPTPHHPAVDTTELDAKITSLTTERDELRSSLEATMKELNGVYDEMYAAEDRATLLTHETESLGKDKERLKGEVASLAGQLDAAKRRVDAELAANDELAALADDAQRARAAERAAVEALGDLTAEADALKYEKVGLVGQVKTLQAAREVADRGRKVLVRRIEELEDNVDDLLRKASEVGDAQELHARLQRLAKEHEGVLSDLSQTQTLLAQTRGRLAQAEATLTPPPSRPASESYRSSRSARSEAQQAGVTQEEVISMLQDAGMKFTDALRDLLREEVQEGVRKSLKDESLAWAMQNAAKHRKEGYNEALHDMTVRDSHAYNVHRRLLRVELTQKAAGAANAKAAVAVPKK